ncbi:hypothetical protein THRCLA_22950 [Thraustotheca clavata]|uniref:Tc1-like transposase DDE domain-containing protein n=1 Tax=Thraustotheca clavata TaxID=74557 RepID=A0A1V9YMD0_9STRA|nr:hypothetical protein THRCLA_22950 [Thraustotheca clavata]
MPRDFDKSVTGIISLFLSPYCPFFNPTETFFSLTMRKMKQVHTDNSHLDFPIIISEIFNFESYNSKPIFEKCGHVGDSMFSSGVGMDRDVEELGFNC